MTPKKTKPAFNKQKYSHRSLVPIVPEITPREAKRANKFARQMEKNKIINEQNLKQSLLLRMLGLGSQNINRPPPTPKRNSKLPVQKAPDREITPAEARAADMRKSQAERNETIKRLGPKAFDELPIPKPGAKLPVQKAPDTRMTLGSKSPEITSAESRELYLRAMEGDPRAKLFVQKAPETSHTLGSKSPEITPSDARALGMRLTPAEGRALGLDAGEADMRKSQAGRATRGSAPSGRVTPLGGVMDDFKPTGSRTPTNPRQLLGMLSKGQTPASSMQPPGGMKKGGEVKESAMMKKEGRGMAKANMQKIADKSVKGHEKRMHGMKSGGLAVGHKSADGCAIRGKTKGRMV